jgi:chromosome segregation ATPase
LNSSEIKNLKTVLDAKKDARKRLMAALKEFNSQEDKPKTDKIKKAISELNTEIIRLESQLKPEDISPASQPISIAPAATPPRSLEDIDRSKNRIQADIDEINTKLEAERKKWETRLEKKQREINELKASMNLRKAELRSEYQLKKHELEKTRNELEEKLRKERSRDRNFEEERGRWSARLNEKQQQADSLRIELADIKAAHHRETETLKGEQAAQVAQLEENLRSTRESLQKIRKEMQQGLAEKQAVIIELNHENAKKDADRERLNASHRSELIGLKKSFSDEKEHLIHRAEIEELSLRSDISELEKKIIALKEESAVSHEKALHSEAELIKNIEKLRDENKQLTSEHLGRENILKEEIAFHKEQLSDSVKKFEISLNEKEREKDLLRENLLLQIESRDADIDRLVKELSRSRIESESEINRLRKVSEKYQKEVEDLGLSLDKQKEEKNNISEILREKLSCLRVEKKELETTFKASEAAHERDLQEMNIRNKDVQGYLNKQIGDLESALDTVSNERNSLLSENSTLKDTVLQLENRTTIIENDREKENMSWSEKLASKETELKENRILLDQKEESLSALAIQIQEAEERFRSSRENFIEKIDSIRAERQSLLKDISAEKEKHNAEIKALRTAYLAAEKESKAKLRQLQASLVEIKEEKNRDASEHSLSVKTLEDSLKNALQRMEKYKEDKNSEINSLRQLYQEKLDDLGASKSKLEIEFGSTREKLSGEIDSLREEKRSMRENTDNTIRALESRLEEEKERFSEYKKEYGLEKESLLSALQDYDSRYEHLKSESLTAKDLLKQSESRIRSLEEEMLRVSDQAVLKEKDLGEEIDSLRALVSDAVFERDKALKDLEEHKLQYSRGTKEQEEYYTDQILTMRSKLEDLEKDLYKERTMKSALKEKDDSIIENLKREILRQRSDYEAELTKYRELVSSERTTLKNNQNEYAAFKEDSEKKITALVSDLEAVRNDLISSRQEFVSLKKDAELAAGISLRREEELSAEIETLKNTVSENISNYKEKKRILGNAIAELKSENMEIIQERIYLQNNVSELESALGKMREELTSKELEFSKDVENLEKSVSDIRVEKDRIEAGLSSEKKSLEQKIAEATAKHRASEKEAEFRIETLEKDLHKEKTSRTALQEKDQMLIDSLKKELIKQKETHDAYLLKLRSQIAEEREILKEEKDRLVSRIAALESENHDDKEKLTRQQEEFLSGSRAAISEHKKEMDGIRAHYEAELASLRDSYAKNIELHRKESSSEQKSLLSEMKETEALAEELKDNLERKTWEVEKVRAEMEKMLKEFEDRVSAAKKVWEDKIKNKDEQIAAVREEFKDIKISYEERIRELKRANGVLVEQLENDRKNWKAEFEEQQKLYKAARLEKEQLSRKQLDEFIVKEQQMLSENNILRKKISELEGIINSHIPAKEEQIKLQASELEEKKIALSSMEKKYIDALEKLKGEFEDYRIKTEERIGKAEQENLWIKAQLTEKEAALNIQKSRFENQLSITTERLESRILEYETEIESLRVQNEEYSRRIKIKETALSAEVEEKAGEAEEIRRRLEEGLSFFSVQEDDTETGDLSGAYDNMTADEIPDSLMDSEGSEFIVSDSPEIPESPNSQDDVMIQDTESPEADNEPGEISSPDDSDDNGMAADFDDFKEKFRETNGFDSSDSDDIADIETAADLKKRLKTLRAEMKAEMTEKESEYKEAETEAQKEKIERELRRLEQDFRNTEKEFKDRIKKLKKN